MTKLLTEVVTRTYEVESNLYKGFNVDIVDGKTEYWDVWLWHDDIGVKEYMFGIKKDYTLKELLELVDDNLAYENYIGGYIEEYMAEEII